MRASRNMLPLLHTLKDLKLPTTIKEMKSVGKDRRVICRIVNDF